MSNIAICLFGPALNESNVLKVEAQLSSFLSEGNKLVYFRDFSNLNPLKNLFNVCWKKQEFEFTNKTIFDTCIAIDPDLFLSCEQELIKETDIKKISMPDIDTMYFLEGSGGNFISIKLSGFFSNSFIFDSICNFSILNLDIDEDRTGGIPSTIEERFYWFVKSLKIKTVCINYENCSLFKRPTTHN